MVAREPQERKTVNTEEYGRMYAAEGTHWWYRGLHAHVRRACARYAPETGRVIDLGCGTGAMAAQLSAGRTVTGVDFAAEGLALSRQRGIGRLVRADVSQVPLADHCADVVLLLDVLYHRNVAEPGVVLREAHRILAPGGCVVLNVPAYGWLRSSHDDAVHTGRRFTRSGILSLVRDAGFEVVLGSYWNSVLFPAIALVRLFRRVLPPSGSDVAESTSPVVNGLLGGVMALERGVMRVCGLPRGVSIFVVARKGGGRL